MKKIILALPLIVLLAGCATKPIPFEKAKQAPADHIYLYQDKTQPTKILVTRDSGFQGFLCAVKFYIDGNLAAELNTSQKATFYVPEGEHTVGADHNCHGPLSETVVTTTTEQPNDIRISVGINGANINRTLYKSE